TSSRDAPHQAGTRHIKQGGPKGGVSAAPDDGAEHPTARIAISPEGEKAARFEHRASSDIVDFRITESAGAQLRADHFSEIHVGLGKRTIHDVLVRTSLYELRGHVLVHFERGQRDMRSNRGEKL